MRRMLLVALIATPILVAPTFAATVVPLPPFTGIEVHGGGHVILMHGANQRVTLIKGDPKVAQIVVHGNTLDASPCAANCGFHQVELELEVVSPHIDAVAAHGGGNIEAKGDFPKQAHISAAAHGGGDIDIRAIPVENVTAEVHGGGDVHVKALISLAASAHGGGDITYSGNPKVSASTHGGGDIRRE